MKALVIGYGSIGSRHVRLLQDLGLTVAVVSRRAIDHENVYPSIASAIHDFKPEYCIIASRTREHLDDFTILAGTGFSGKVLVEKPLFASNCAVPDNTFSHIYVAYNLRFHPVLQRFSALLANTRPYFVHAYVGQYLPDWRPGTDYRQSYSAIRAEGGGVLRDLSHELDFLNWILGGWHNLTALGGKVSDLDIDSDDVFSILFETKRCPVVSANLNYLDPKLTRQILALTNHGAIRADLANGTVTFEDKTEHFVVDRDTSYIAQHNAVIGNGSCLCTLAEGLAVTKMIEASERAAGRLIGAHNE